MRIILGIVALLAIAIGVSFLGDGDKNKMVVPDNGAVTQNTSDEQMESKRSQFSDGTYSVKAESSKVNWAGKKPLIEGYVNSGALALKDGGSVTVSGGVATGEFVIDMNSLSVSATPKKPGKENLLEQHLKSEGWFNIEAYPEASFKINTVSARADSDSTFIYDVKGDLTMKGVTHELSFPAQVYLDEQGLLHADASLEFDRTLWGITAGSGKFFDSLADNMIDDMVALSFSLVAEKQ